jgi:hypothetical protein
MAPHSKTNRRHQNSLNNLVYLHHSMVNHIQQLEMHRYLQQDKIHQIKINTKS